MIADYAHILEGCRRHDRRAQRALYEAFAPMVMGVCMRYSTDRDAAQDLLQDSYVKVFESINQVRDPERLKTWVYKVAVNECLQRIRRQRPVVYADEVEIDGVQLPLDPFGAEEVVAALQRLAPAQRLAFNLVEVEGYTFEECAEQMRCSEVNVRALLSRAKACLREILTEKQ
ncbi:MAG: RNA polymerase sigma factor [Bacteroidales bacterium]|nr:RNA polymerase sigma factor [Bacteroidales bacterium]